MKDELEKLLGQDSPLTRVWPEFKARQGQLAMALEVARVFQTSDLALVEAGTGTGKTLAYLLPALLSGKKTVISTGLKNLQDQIFEKDLPFIRQFFGDNFLAVRLKGRENYLCLYYLQKILSQPNLSSTAKLDIFLKVARRAKEAPSGDRVEFPFIPENSPLWVEISASVERCLGQRCPDFGDCFLWKARRAAAVADLVLVNHHLFMADLAVRAGGFGEVLPVWEAAIFDEAHLVEEAATSYFGRSVSSGALLLLYRDLGRALATLSLSDVTRLKPLVEIIGRQSEALTFYFCRQMMEKELWADDDPESGPLREFLLKFHYDLLALIEKLNTSSRDNKILTGLLTRLQTVAADLLFIAEGADHEFVYQADRQNRRLILAALPIRISHHLAEGLIQSGRPLVFTSATLSSDGDFTYFKDRLGLWPEVEGLVVESSFDYARRTLVYIPKNLPSPTAPDFPERMVEEVEKILALSRGRALVLFTSYKNMNFAAGCLRARLPWPLLVQGETSRAVTLAEFSYRTESVLFATHSFWQGVDVPGESLTVVIIEKLPFPRPDRPLIRARSALLVEEGRNPFFDYFIPEAALTLKQGLGRLMRHCLDQGLLAILDRRLLTKAYGRKLLKALPPSPRTSELETVAAFLKNI